MKAFTKILSLAVVSLSMLAACGEEVSSSSVAPTDQDYADAAVESTICISDYNGAIILPTTTPILYAEGIDFMKTVVVEGVADPINLDWVAEDEARWTVTDEGTYWKAVGVRPLSAETNVTTQWTVTATVGEATASVEYSFTIVKLTEEEEFGLPLTPLSQLRSITLGTKLRTRGYVTMVMSNDANANDRNFYIQSGEYGVYIYTAYNNFNVVEGDFVDITGMLTSYEGLLELTKVSKTDPLVVRVLTGVTGDAPVALTVTEGMWSAAGLAGQDARLVNISGLVFKSGTVSNVTSVHSTIYFTLGTTDVMCYVNYHIGTTAQTEIKTLIEGLVAGDTVDYHGMLTWYGGPQLGPNGGANFTVHHAA